MTKYLISISLAAAAAALVLLSSCTDFEELNTNPTKSTGVDPNSQLTYAQLMTWGDWLTVQTYAYYCAPFAQLMQGDWATTQYGGQYRRYNEYMNGPWERIYTISLKNLIDAADRSKGVERYTNVRQIIRIMQVYYFTILTDLYGDIPYAEAGKGFTEDIISPVYSTQKYIYHDMLKELREAAATFDPALPLATGDVIFKGDVAKWKRLANSMRLRLAMRLTKVEPETALAEVSDILSDEAGLLTEADDALIAYMNLNDWDAGEFRRNALSQQWYGRETFPTPYVCSTLWDKLRETNDPRTLRIARCYSEEGYTTIPFGRVDLTDEMLALKGWNQFQPVRPGYFWYDNWPSGYQSTLTKAWEMKACRPVINNAFLRTDVPGVIMTYAETQLLLAEARARWGAQLPAGDADAAGHYRNGVRAAMKFLNRYGVETITDTEIAAFLDANPLPATLQGQLKSINEQLWILHLLNLPEAYANWRRSGYPELRAASEYGALTIDSRTIPRRLNYPQNEASYNSASYQEAIAAMGGTDSWNARVWWDAE